MTPFALPERPRILVVALRRIGDVLLATPLIRSIRRAWPDAAIDALVFNGTQGILEGNPDLDNVVVMPARPSAAESLRLAAQLWKRYALAVATEGGDRPVFFALAAGRQTVAPVEARLSGTLKKSLLTRSVPAAPEMHRLPQTLRLAEALGIAPVAEVVPPAGSAAPAIGGDYAVIHAGPMFRYKQWTAEGWRTVATALQTRGLDVVATGGPADAEYLDAVWGGTNVRRLDGQLRWPQLAALIANAKIYVGPDTSVTHLAAATGCPTVALYGPTDPRQWGPVPAHGLTDLWQAAGTLQRRGNVFLVQNPLSCLPCRNEGCEKHVGSYSLCLDQLSARQVLAAVDAVLGPSKVRVAAAPARRAAGPKTGKRVRAVQG